MRRGGTAAGAASSGGGSSGGGFTVSGSGAVGSVDVAGGGTGTDVQVIKFAFLDKDYTQVQWGVGGVTADYVDGQRRP